MKRASYGLRVEELEGRDMPSASVLLPGVVCAHSATGAPHANTEHSAVAGCTDGTKAAVTPPTTSHACDHANPDHSAVSCVV